MRSLLAAGHFPQSVINTIRLNWYLVDVVYESISRYTGALTASELRERKQPKALFRAVELLVGLRR